MLTNPKTDLVAIIQSSETRPRFNDRELSYLGEESGAASGSTVGSGMKQTGERSGERDEADRGAQWGARWGLLPTQREAGVRAALPRSFLPCRSTQSSFLRSSQRRS